MTDYNVFVKAVRTMTEPAPASEYNETGITYYVLDYEDIDDVYFIRAPTVDLAKDMARERFLDEYAGIDKDSLVFDIVEAGE